MSADAWMFVFAALGLVVGFYLGAAYAWWIVRRERTALERRVRPYISPSQFPDPSHTLFQRPRDRRIDLRPLPPETTPTSDPRKPW
jgi:hypothetical protein